MTVWDLVKETEALLSQMGSSEARLEAEVLVMHVTGWARAGLYARLGEELSQTGTQALDSLVQRRLQGEPLAYIVGHKEFFGLDFYVDQRAFIPRPETELLVEASLEFIQHRTEKGLACLAADIGAGSGAIAVALALHVPQTIIYATDIAKGALEVAALNCQRHGVEDRVRLLLGDMLSPLPEPVDLMVINPPYVKDVDLPTCSERTKGWAGEPMVALDGGEDGLDKIRQLLKEAPSKLRPGGGILMEIGWDQAQRVREVARKRFPDAEISVTKDLAGLDRMVAMMLPFFDH